tara:strand:- start:2586 stop:3404 length:819 start_codon:yes stop_codon:yes gene_type:complete
MTEKNINETCSICYEKATGRFYEIDGIRFPRHYKDDVTFRLQASFFELKGKVVLICPYCQMTLDNLPEYFDSYLGMKSDCWQKIDLNEDYRIISKLLTKAFKNIESLRKNVLPKKNELEERIRQIVEENEHKRKVEEENRKAEEILAEERAQKSAEKRKKRMAVIAKKILKLLKDKAVKMPASDIDAFLKHQDVDEIKELCEKMYHNSEISRTANYRYFILTEEKKKPKKTLAPKSEAVDVKAELKKYKEMLDEGLITQEAYDAKMNQLLGL